MPGTNRIVNRLKIMGVRTAHYHATGRRTVPVRTFSVSMNPKGQIAGPKRYLLNPDHQSEYSILADSNDSRFFPNNSDIAK